MASPDFDKLTFGLENTAPYMFVAKWTAASGWVTDGVVPFGNLSMPPSAQILNYGQGLFEGMKAQSSPNGDILLFRPRENARRMQDGARRMLMQVLPESIFLRGVTDLVRKNITHVPPLGKGAMYIRPLLLGTGGTLGLAAAPEFTFVIYSAAVGSYFASGALKPINLKVEDKNHRAAPLGVGAAKCAGNYGAGLCALYEAKAAGFTDVVYLDARSDSYLEELSAANIFVVKGKKICTPPLVGTILPGVTRKSILQIATDLGFEAVEENVPIQEALEADEVFTSGTAVVICPVGSLTYKGDKSTFCDGNVGPVCQQLYDALTQMQTGQSEDKYGWTVELSKMDDVVSSAE